jgi:polyisoprenoid-binding protein YceI
MKSNLKRAILALMFTMVAGANYVYGQCDKTITLKSSKTVMLDEEGKIERTKDEATTITISKTFISIAPGESDANTMSGDITSKTCEWTTPYKIGKTVVKGILTNGNGNELHATLTIVGVDGKVTLTFEAEEKGKRKVQVVADKFE